MHDDHDVGDNLDETFGRASLNNCFIGDAVAADIDGGVCKLNDDDDKDDSARDENAAG